MTKLLLHHYTQVPDLASLFSTGTRSKLPSIFFPKIAILRVLSKETRVAFPLWQRGIRQTKFVTETKSGSNAVEMNILLRREFTDSIWLFQDYGTRKGEGRARNMKKIQAGLENLSGKGHSVQKKEVIREMVGLAGKSDLWMKKVAEQTMIEWNLMKRSRSAGGANWPWHEAENEEVKEWEQDGN